ncbi:MAG: DMT family transporter [Chlamydiales bacterium]|nr:DMT family transporter [Chlamydiales bacterium]
MWLGLFFAISACFVWGAIFVIPEFLSDFSGVEIVLGRYLVYGIISAVLFLRYGFEKIGQIPKTAWIKAFTFALFSNIIYYLGIIGGIRFASAPLAVLIIGTAPIVIALYGNWHAREISFKSMIIPCIWILFGVVMVDLNEIDWSFTTDSLQYMIGLSGALAALIAWSWYAVHNARFLKRNPNIPSTEWATLIGVCTLFWAVLMGIVFAFIFEQGVDLSKFTHWSSATVRFLIGSLILGIVCSWLGCYFWNRASVYLPVSLMGPFLIFESIFGLVFVYSYNLRLPSLYEVIGIISMLGGILLTVIIFRRQLAKKSSQ